MKSTFNAHDRAYRPNLIEKLSNYPVTVCGAGAIGSNLVDGLTRMGAKDVLVYDFDRVSNTNQGTQVYSARLVGMLKYQALISVVFENTGMVIKGNGFKITEHNVERLLSGLVIEAFDNAKSKMLVNNACEKLKLPCVHVGMNVDYAGIRWANSSYNVESGDIDLCDYPLARNLVMLTTAVLSETILRFIDTGEQNSYAITLKDLRIWNI